MTPIRTFQFGQFTTTTSFIELDELEKLLPADSLFVFDKNTAPLFPTLSSGNRAVILDPGEEHKNWNSVKKILKRAVDLALGRDGTIVGMGGGVLCDMSAFAASTYMRGCSLILLPTTLLAMTDASLGGKGGFDFSGYKNMVGSFYPASKIYYCPEILRTLPEKEFLGGLAEVIKTAMLGDRALLSLLHEKREEILDRNPNILLKVIEACVLVKGAFVQEDLYEKGVRAYLNLGHTFAHALEKVSHFRWSHGEAVAWGLLMAMETGIELGICDNYYALEIRKLLEDYNFPLKTDCKSELLTEAMKGDKKKKGGRVRFILQREQGDTLIRIVDEALIATILKRNTKQGG